MNDRKPATLWDADLGDGTYKNPVICADYGDPDAIRVGEDYFMVATSSCASPAVPLLHSRDLIHWKVINYVMDRLPFDKYDKAMQWGQDWSGGAWAPAIRYHDGVYYVMIPLPDEGIMMCKTENPWGKWSEPVFAHKVVGWIDPCPFWDDDGSAYMVSAFARSRIGFQNVLYLTRMSPDCSRILDEGKFIYDGHATQPIIEGPKLYKRNGYYYIFAPAGGMDCGWQTILRSRNIYGPYEEKIVMHQGNTQINGPHQGAWITTPDGEEWFLHFHCTGNGVGRVVYLQPLRWENDWPVIGINEVDGCGEPALQYRKPNIKLSCPAEGLADTDYFEGSMLGLQWQWNANYKKEWYQLENGQLTLYSQNIAEGTKLCDISNILSQKWTAPEFQVVTCLHLEDLIEGDAAGMVALGAEYSSIFIRRWNEKLFFEQRYGYCKQDEELREELEEITQNKIYLRMQAEQVDGVQISFSYSYEGSNFIPIGRKIDVSGSRKNGASGSSLMCGAMRSGLVAVNEIGVSGGKVRSDYFVFEHLDKQTL